jgi:hypothetical protein
MHPERGICRRYFFGLGLLLLSCVFARLAGAMYLSTISTQLPPITMTTQPHASMSGSGIEDTIPSDISTAYEMVRRDSENWLGFIEDTEMYPVTNSEFRYTLRLCRGLRRVVLVVEEDADVWGLRRGADLWCSQSVDEEYAKDEGDEENFGGGRWSGWMESLLDSRWSLWLR